MSLNKNISIWRGYNAPPTLNHLWVDETNNIKININNEWVSILEIISDTILDNHINNIENNVIPKAIADGIAQVVADAPEDLDTLKEVADYIASDESRAADILQSLANLAKKDEELQTALDEGVASSEQMYESLLSSITTATNDMRSSTPVFDRVVTGDVTLTMGSATTNYTVVYLEDKKVFAALNAGKYWANWIAWGKYPSAVSYGPAPAVGKIYIMDKALFAWNGVSLQKIGDFDDIKKSITTIQAQIGNINEILETI